MTEEKEIVSKEETFDKLEIRLGRVISVEEEPSAPKKAYKMKIDFGKFGIKTSVGRFTQHAPEEIKGKLVLGILNFPPRQIGEELHVSRQFLVVKNAHAWYNSCPFKRFYVVF